MIPRKHLESTFQRMPEAGGKFQELRRVIHARRSAYFTGRRKGERYFIRTRMSVVVPQEDTDRPDLLLKGFSHEMSLSGVSFVPEQNGSRPEPLRQAENLINRKVCIRILADGITVEVPGEVVRTDELAINGHKLLSLAIQFTKMTPQVRGMVLAFAENARVHLPAAEHECLFSCPLDHDWRI
jgi:hypothetical protein